MKLKRKNFNECVICVFKNKYVNLSLRTFDRLLNKQKLVFLSSLGCWGVLNS